MSSKDEVREKAKRLANIKVKTPSQAAENLMALADMIESGDDAESMEAVKAALAEILRQEATNLYRR